MKAAYYTVEATFVMMIVIWVMFTIFYGGLFVHDRMMLGSVMNGLAMDDTDETIIKSELDKKMFLLQVEEVKQEKGLISTDVTVRYRLSMQSTVIRNLFQKGRDSSYTITRETVNPAAYKWDYDIVKEKG